MKTIVRAAAWLDRDNGLPIWLILALFKLLGTAQRLRGLTYRESDPQAAHSRIGQSSMTGRA